MRIGIIGGGAAGLSTSWLLDEQHDVTLFERADRLGGHADTVTIDFPSGKADVEAGFEFFSGSMFPTYVRMLEHLRVPLRQFPLSVTVHRTDCDSVQRLPPVQEGEVLWSELSPRRLSRLLQLKYVVSRAESLVASKDDQVTVRAFLGSLALSRDFVDEFLYPLLQGGWGLHRPEVEGLSAYNVFKYYVHQQPSGLRPFYWSEIVGGTSSYVDAVARDLGRTVVHTGARVAGITRSEGGWIVEDRGVRHRFDALVIATNANTAASLLAGVDATARQRELLRSVRYFETRIAVHGDRSWMPRDPRDWAVLNMQHDVATCAATMWKPWRTAGHDVFRSWVTHAERLPTPLYALRVYEHVVPDPTLFAVQRKLAPLQGQSNLWLAGSYTGDVDCHESAIVSAVKIALRLAPESTRLRALTGRPPRSAAVRPIGRPRNTASEDALLVRGTTHAR